MEFPKKNLDKPEGFWTSFLDRWDQNQQKVQSVEKDRNPNNSNSSVKLGEGMALACVAVSGNWLSVFIDDGSSSWMNSEVYWHILSGKSFSLIGQAFIVQQDNEPKDTVCQLRLLWYKLEDIRLAKSVIICNPYWVF